MRVVALVSLLESVLSLLGSAYLAVRCASQLQKSADADSHVLQRRRHVQLILLMIGVADFLGASSWASTESVSLGLLQESVARCALAELLGLIGFAAMSLWTCCLAWSLHGMLTLHRTPAPLGRCTLLGLWGIALALCALVVPNHLRHACQGAGPPSDSSASFVAQVGWLVLFAVGPLAAAAFISVQYVRVRLHFVWARRLSRALTGTPLPDVAAASGRSDATIRSTIASTSDADRGVATRLDVRLLSYLVAYLACQLPGLPALLRDPSLRANDNAVYLQRQETDILVAVRVVTQSIQGAVNALVFVHHARITVVPLSRRGCYGGCLRCWGGGGHDERVTDTEWDLVE